MCQMKAVGILFLSVFGIHAFRLFAVPLPEARSSSQSQSGAEADKKKAKKVYTNDDLIRLRTEQDRNQSKGSGSQAPVQKQADGSLGSSKAGDNLSLSTYRDLNGHGRSYWHDKIKPMRSELESLNSQIQGLQAQQTQVGPAAGIKVTRSGRLQTQGKNQESLERRIETLSQKRSQVQKSLQDLEEEARKVQALPEWLR